MNSDKNLFIDCDMETNAPIYLNVGFKDKDEAKKLGAKWDANAKKWYAINNDKELIERWGVKKPIKNIIENNKLVNKKIYLSYVFFQDKDDAKKLGAKWDNDKKSWYAFENQIDLINKYGRYIEKNKNYKIILKILRKLLNIYVKNNKSNQDNNDFSYIQDYDNYYENSKELDRDSFKIIKFDINKNEININYSYRITTHNFHGSYFNEYRSTMIIKKDEKNLYYNSLKLNNENMGNINVLDYFNLIYLLLQKEQINKIKPLQCVAICKNLINSNFNRPYNLTEHIIEQYI